MSNAAGNQAQIANNAASVDATNAASSFGAASGDIGTYLSNVNSTLAAGNPFQAKDYLTNQNLETSGAMNAANDAERERLGQTVAKTGTNSAALANTVASSARQGQRDLTTYNAGRDTANENTWLQQQDKLLGDEATGSSQEAGLYGTSIGGQDSKLGTAQTGEDAQSEENDGLIKAGIGAAGAAATGGLSAGGAFAGGCWIAAELYGGWSDPRTIIVRRWVVNDLRRTLIGAAAHWAYGKWGERMAEYIKTHNVVRSWMQRLFDRALAAARRKYE